MRGKREQWSARVAQWRDSGLSQAAYCREHGLSVSSFGYWRRRLEATAGDDDGRVLPIVMATPPAEAASLRVHLPGGVWLQLARAGRSDARVGAGAGACGVLRLQSWWLVTGPTDLRCGMDRLLLQVREALGRAPGEGEGYVFGNRAGTRIKLLACDRHGVWLAARRLQQGRFVWPRAGDTSWQLSAEQFAWLCAEVDWQRLSIAPMTHGQAL